MTTIGTITLKQGTGKNSGKPYTALSLVVGKWRGLHFPTAFERDYLVEYLKDNQGYITINRDKETLQLHAGEYSHEFVVDSKFEYKYIDKFFRDNNEEAPVGEAVDNNIDLETESPAPAGGIFS